MGKYTQLTNEQRYQISGLKRTGLNQSQIAEEVGVNKSTISRELRRNKGQRGWKPKQAQEAAEERRRGRTNATRFSPEDLRGIEALIRKDLSPEQVSGRLSLEGELQISHETIYQYIYRDKASGGTLWSHLRCQKQRRKRYGSGQERRGMIKNRVSIDQRPPIVEQRIRIGDWEGDTVIGKNHKGALVTLAERKSRYTLAGQLPGKHAAGVTAMVNSLLAPYKSKCHTVTFDNGKEFSDHENIAKALKTGVYFAHPYSSWERGLNENTNGLLRQYFPKSTDFEQVTSAQVQSAVDRLNHRPRKILGFRTPFEVFFGKKTGYVFSLSTVALQT